MARQNSSQFPYKAYIRHHILDIGNYVFCRLRFILAFFSFVFNTLVIIAVSINAPFNSPIYICHLSNIPELKSHVLFSNFRIESWRRRTPVSIPTRRA